MLFIRNTDKTATIDGKVVPIALLKDYDGTEILAVRPPYGGGGYVTMADFHLLSDATLND